MENKKYFDELILEKKKRGLAATKFNREAERGKENSRID